MKNRENLLEMTTEQLMEMSGGGFAYDVGRFLRYIALGGTTANPRNAYVDFVVNEIVNDIVND